MKGGTLSRLLVPKPLLMSTNAVPARVSNYASTPNGSSGWFLNDANLLSGVRT